MKLMVLQSSSRANGYVLTNGTEALLIEAGVRLFEVKKALGFKLSAIRGCIVSHRHHDHARYVREYAKNGVTILGPAEALMEGNPRCKTLLPFKGYLLGRFRIIPFELEHDAACFGYVIDHPGCGRILFATDTWMIPYQFSQVNHFVVECNYSDELLDRAILSGKTHPSMRSRLMATHMELGVLSKYFSSIDLKETRSITLVHLSDEHTDEGLFINQLVRVSARPVYAAKPGMSIDMGIFC